MSFRKSKRYHMHLLVVVLTGSLLTAVGHDTFQTTTFAKVTAAGLEVQMTLSQAGANKLLRDSGSALSQLNLTNFDAMRPKLAELAAGLLEITIGGEVLSLLDVKVVAGEAGDVEFLLSYKRPAVEQVKLNAAYMEKLGAGFYTEMTLLDEAGQGPIISLNPRNVPVVEWVLKRANGSRISAPIPKLKAEPVPVLDSQNAALSTEPVSAAGSLPADHSPEQKNAKSGGENIYAIFAVALVCLAGTIAWRFRPKAAR